MPIAVLDTDAECPDCDHRGAWVRTIVKQPRTTERFRCEAYEAHWSVTR